MDKRRTLSAMVLSAIVATACSAGGFATGSGQPSDTPPTSTADTLTLRVTPTSSVVPTASPTPAAEATPTAEPTPTAAPTPTPLPTLTPTDPGVAPNDDPPGTSITALPFTDFVNVSRAQIHAMEMASRCGSGTQSVWYSYVASADGVLVADTAGSDYDTILDVWRGQLSADVQDPGFEQLDAVACTYNNAGSTPGGVVFDAVAGQPYAIRVSTALNAIGGELRFGLHVR